MKNHTIILTEEQMRYYTEAKDVLSELVYANGINRNKVNLTYDDGRFQKHRDNINKLDKIKTDKMESDNADTYEVPLKGGMTSYNITSISGTEIMHYFKHYWDSKKAKMNIDGNEYEMDMQKQEFDKFMGFFKRKVWAVISHCVSQYETNGDDFKPTGISILPVQSSSNFNEKMASILSGAHIGNLPCQVISGSIFQKDLRNLEKDTEFINKNREYFSGKYYADDDVKNSSDTTTPEQHVDSEISKIKKINSLKSYAKKMDELSAKLISLYYRYNVALKNAGERGTKNTTKALVDAYKEYFDTFETIRNEFRDCYTAANGEVRSIQTRGLVTPIKSTKGPSVEKRSEAIWNTVKPYLKGQTSKVTGLAYTKTEVVQYKETPFQIKKLMDPVRMGMRNIYNPNEDAEFVQKEVDKTKGTVFVIFDDNISGGATLSDICYQAKKLGIEHIIPITFGQMARTVAYPRQAKINTPKKEDGSYGFNMQ